MDSLQQGVASLGLLNPAADPITGFNPPTISPCANLIQSPDGKTLNCANGGRSAAFMGDGPPMATFGNLNYLWGNVPAFDVLNLEKNEGVGYAKDIDLCFAASGDLRNMICSVNGLSNSYKGTCAIVLNDKNYNVVARNITMLLLAAHLPPLDAAELILHVWYSGRLSQGMLDAIKKYVKEAVAEVVAKIKGKSDNVMQSKKWTYGDVEMRVCLYKPQWNTLLQILEAKHEVQKTEQERQKIVLAPSRIDYRDRELYKLSGPRRLCTTKFRETGVLAPFGSCLEQFNCSNPLLFNETNSTWLQKDSASPLDGWSIQNPSNLQLTPKNDINGRLYFYVREFIQEFCRRIQHPLSRTHFTLFCLDAAHLPKYLKRPVFDRLEVSNIADDYYLNVHRTLAIFAPLLKSPSVNPHAALITLFLNACEMVDYVSVPNIDRANIAMIMRYAHLTHSDMIKAVNPATPEAFKFYATHQLLRDYDRLFADYEARVKISEAARNAGLRMRVLNRVIEAWPMRLKKRPGDQGAEEEFKALMESGCTGAERYVEWIRRE
ncbi:MAG: hypothetical protein Q9195_005361 [Heterodermia aff. obscurata]